MTACLCSTAHKHPYNLNLAPKLNNATLRRFYLVQWPPQFHRSTRLLTLGECLNPEMLPWLALFNGTVGRCVVILVFAPASGRTCL